MAAFIVVHKMTPDQHVGLQSFNTNYWCFFCEIQFFRRFLNTFSRYRWSEICMMWNSTFDFPIWMSSPRSSVLARAGFEDSSLRSGCLVPQERASSCCLSWEYGVGFCLMFRVGFLSRDESTTLFQLWIPRAFWITHILRRIDLRSQEVHWHHHWSRFRHCQPLLRSIFLSSLEHDTLLFVRQKMAAGKHQESMIFKKRRRRFHSSRVKFFFWLTCLRVGFGCQLLWLRSWGPNWFCRTTLRVQFWTRVSLLDFCPFWSFWSPLHCLRKCTTETHLEKGVRLWWRETIHQLLGFPFVWSWFLWFLLRNWLVVWYCSMNVTLLSPRSINQEQVIHPSAVQQPTK